MTKKKAFAMAICAALANVGFALPASAAEETMTTEVAPVVVEGAKDLLPGGMMVASDRVGILGDMDAVDVPFTERQYAQKTIEMFENPNQPMNGVLANNPSIVITSMNPHTTDFSIRGINMNGTQYAINNVPGLFSQFNGIPTHVLERVDITSGPNTVLNGATFAQDGRNGVDPAGGRLNGTTKKATDKDINKYTQKFSGRGTWTEGFEIGRRLGKDKQWGVLVNARVEKGDLAMKGGSIEDKSVYINLDRKGQRSKTNLFGGYFDKHLDGGQRWFLVGAKQTSLPAIPDLKNNYSFDGQFRDIHGYLFTLNHEQKISENWQAFANMGYAYNKQQYNEYWSNAPTIAADGKITGRFRDYRNESHSGYIQAGAINSTKINDKTKNDLSFAYDYLNYRARSSNVGAADKPGGSTAYSGIFGTLGAGITSVDYFHKNGALVKASLGGWNKETAHSFTLADRFEFGKAAVYAALQYRKSDYTAYKTATVSSNNWNPTFAFAYKPLEKLSLYASYATSYTRANRVGTSYYNAGEVLDPVKNKQTEIGVKYENGGVLHSLALFQTKQASYIAEDIGLSKDYYGPNGENKFKGVEYYATGKLAPKWNLMGGFMYLNGTRENLAKADKAYEGSRVTGVPRWNFVLAAEYAMDDNNSVFGRMNACTDSVANNAGLKTGGYTTFDLGYRHRFKLSKTDVTVSATCFNLFGKDYWLARGSVNNMTLGAPRTFALSAAFEF